MFFLFLKAPLTCQSNLHMMQMMWKIQWKIQIYEGGIYVMSGQQISYQLIYRHIIHRLFLLGLENSFLFEYLDLLSLNAIALSRLHQFSEWLHIWIVRRGLWLALRFGFKIRINLLVIMRFIKFIHGIAFWVSTSYCQLVGGLDVLLLKASIH